MPINPELLAILVCPLCKDSVRPTNNGLQCATCRRVYPIIDDIPVMLVDKATKE